MTYNPAQIEPKWQAYWEKQHTFQSLENSTKPKYYVLDMFPYPSSTGLHVGHPEGYTATDILARYKRARGYNVLHPMGWDAFGLPAEQHAIKTGVHPEKTTQSAIDSFRRQLKRLGFSYDWSREISTCAPDYYKWTQWIFLRLFERGLAYQNQVAVNWCPELKTVLANEEVVDGKSERGGHPVYRVPMKQWMLKITAYAERLLTDLDGLDWPESTKELQRNWIGKSEGLELQFEIENSGGKRLEVYTTRPDTLWGVTFAVLAPEHPLVGLITHSSCHEEVQAYIAQASRKSEVARQDQSKEKTGCFTGAYALHPVTQKRIPIWIADYVMMGYGTGAVMGVPGHDERDQDFAQKFGLEIKSVINADGIAFDSDFINGLDSKTAIKKVVEWAEKNGIGRGSVKYKLRDWLFSRQRYWGEPFPLIKHDDGRISGVSDHDLPVTLPEVERYEPSGTGESPLSVMNEWKTVKRDVETWMRETDTMPGSAGSSWYFLRYCDPLNARAFADPEKLKYWMPVDLYLGGPEHAVGHLLYARFWTKVLFDAGLCPVSEPFKKLVHQGMILGPDGEKMSKSRGNVINPDDVVNEYGADTLRLYEMFMGPLEKDKPWSTQAIEGVYRFLNRVWRLYEHLAPRGSEPTVTDADLTVVHQTIQKVTEDIEGLRFNTAISQMMVFVNHFTAQPTFARAAAKPFVQVLAPFAPHLACELWEALGETTDLNTAPWPVANPQYLAQDTVTLAVQVLGKLRGTLTVSKSVSAQEIEDQARALDGVARHLEGKQVVKVIQVPGKIVNFVVK